MFQDVTPPTASTLTQTVLQDGAGVQQGTGGWAVAITVAIFALLLFGLFRYLWPLWTTSRAFRSATSSIPSVDANVAEGKVPNSTKPFSLPHLNELWTQFHTDWYHTRLWAEISEGEDKQLVSTVAPEDVFTEHAVLRGYNRNMALTLAGVFTGLGILGTFLGLVTGLATIEGAQQTQLMTSIMGLLGGMHTAFYTSILGIATSLVWLFLDRALFHQVQRDIEGFFLEVRKRYRVESADWLLYRLLKVEEEESAAIHHTNEILDDHKEIHGKANRLLDEQTRDIKEIGTALATAFEDALSKSVNEKLEPLLKGVIASVEKLSTQLGDRQVKMMGQLVDGFVDQISVQLSGHFEQLAGALKNAAEWQERVHGDLDRLVDRVQQATEGQREVIERSTAACDLFQESLADLAHSHTLIDQAANRIETTANRVGGELERLGEQLTGRLSSLSSDLARDLERTAAVVDGISAALTASVERIDLQAQSLEKRIEQLDAQQETYRSANEDLRVHLASQLDALGGQVEDLHGFWTGFRDDLSGVGDHLKSSVAEFSVFTAQKLGEIFSRFDAEMATVVEHLSGTLAEMREVTEDLPSGVERLRITLEDAVKPIAETGKHLSELPQTLQTVDRLATGITQLRERLDRTDTALEEAGRSITSLTTAMSDVPALTGAVQSLRPIADNLREVTAQMSGTDQSLALLREQLASTGREFLVTFDQIASNGDARKHAGSPEVPPAGRSEQ